MAGRPRSELIDVIRGSALFGSLSQRQLAAVAKVCFERSYSTGDVLVRQADHGQQMLALISGTARVERDGRTIGSVRGGDLVGEMSLIDGLPCSATVVAETTIETLVLYRTAFRKLLADIPTLSSKLLLAQTARVRELDRRAAVI